MQSEQEKVDKKKEEPNYEKLYINILDLKNDSTKSLRIFSEFLRNFIKNNLRDKYDGSMKLINVIKENKQVMRNSKGLTNTRRYSFPFEEFTGVLSKENE